MEGAEANTLQWVEYHEIPSLLFLKESRTYSPEELQAQLSGGMLHAEMYPERDA